MFIILFSFFFEDVPLVEFIHLVFTRTPGGVTVGDSGFRCCVPCLLSAIISLCLLIHKTDRGLRIAASAMRVNGEPVFHGHFVGCRENELIGAHI